MEKKFIIEQIKLHLASKENEPEYVEQRRGLIEDLTEDDILFGEEPSYFYAYLQCNSTGVGGSYFKDTETRRTVARDYNTDELLFIDGDENTCRKGLQLYVIPKGKTITYYKRSEMEKIAKQYGFQLHQQYFHDLNFILRDHRLNRYQVYCTKGPIKMPIRSVFGKTKDGKKFLLGYIYEKNDKKHFLIDICPPKVKAEKKSSKKWWIYLLGFIFPPIWIIGIFCLLVKGLRERFMG